MIVKKACLLLGLIVALQLTKHICIGNLLNQYGEGRLEAYAKEEGTMNYEQIKATTGYKEYRPGLLLTKNLSIESHLHEQEVMAVATNGYLGIGAPLYFLYGAYFSEAAVEENRDIAIISDTLAKKLFNSQEAIGNSFEVEGKVYQIVGVYERIRTIGQWWIDTEIERIYVPITSSVIEEDKPVTGIWLVNEGREQLLNDEVLEQLIINRQDWLIKNDFDYKAILETYLNINYSLMGVILTALALKRIFIVLTEIPSKMSLGVMSGLISIGIGVLGLFLLRKAIYLPKDFLPSYNLFELGHYLNYIKNQLVVHNQMSYYALAEFERLFWMTKIGGMLVNLLMLVLYFPLLKEINFLFLSINHHITINYLGYTSRDKDKKKSFV